MTLKLKQISQQPMSLISSPKRRVARCLFGTPDRTETDQWLQKKLNEVQSEKSQKWNFDFATDTPTSSSDSNWVWMTSDVSSMPKFYSEQNTSRLCDDEEPEKMEISSQLADCKSKQETPKKKPIRRMIHSPGAVSKRSLLSAYFLKKKRSISFLAKNSQSNSVDRTASKDDISFPSPLKKPRL